MSFRSYHAGKTIIRATSPDMKDATIEIKSLGEPKFIAGQTRPVKPRPYARFTGNETAGSQVTLGRENPTRASSEALGHGGQLANDGNPLTFWQADARDTAAWWRVDLERIVNVSKTKLKFPAEGNWRYKLELSDDGENRWKVVADETLTASVSRERTDVMSGGSLRGRFLRVSITAAPDGQLPALSELEITDELSSM